MKTQLLLLLMFCSVCPLFAQNVYQIRADSVRIYNVCDTAELILENRTSQVNGYLFNKGNGRTEFRKLKLLNVGGSRLAIAGQDTIDLRTLNIVGIDTAYRSGDSLRFEKGGKITRLFAPLPAPEGYILNRMSIPQQASFNISGEGRTSVRFSVIRNGSNGFMNSFILLDTTGTRGANLQLTGGDTAGVAMYVNNGAMWVKRMEIGPIGNSSFYSNLSATGSFSMGQGVEFATLSLLGNTGNFMVFPNRGIAPPAYTTRSNGTKIVFYSALNAANTEFAYGLETQHLWQSVPTAAANTGFKWYGGTREAMKLTGEGVLTVQDRIRTDLIWGDSSGLVISGNNSEDTLILIGGGTGPVSARGGQINLHSGGDTASTARGGITFHTGIVINGAQQPERMRITGAGRVGIATNVPHSTLQLMGSFAPRSTTVTGSLSLTEEHCNVAVDNAAAATITLPLANSCGGREYSIVKTSSSAAAVTVVASGSDKINGGTSVSLATQFKTVSLWSNGVLWLIKYAN
ncbi:hypothetical protein ACQKLP_12890 [Chitinophaga sp. NPDC101104]|uniref:hypothetical protein n=1 Tax=Chitinophaga sp. NPDC101104 TaxID=3390561 RepID=UPI003D044720